MAIFNCYVSSPEGMVYDGHVHGTNYGKPVEFWGILSSDKTQQERDVFDQK